MSLEIEGKEYELEYDPQDPFVYTDNSVAYCDQLARDFMPIIIDHKEYGSKPYPPEFIAYRLLVDSKKEKLCILYEVYWKRQECIWRGIVKNHDHDYEQIQVHFDTDSGKLDKVVVSSWGPLECAGHGVEVYSNISKPDSKAIDYTTSSKRSFPWGGDNGQKNLTQITRIPIEKLTFDNKRPTILVIACYHIFVGLKKNHLLSERNELDVGLKRLDQKLLENWYYRHIKNRFGHDISRVFFEPYIMYYPPPEDLLSRAVYGLLWFSAFIKRKVISLISHNDKRS